MRIISIFIFLFTSSLAYSQEFTKEVQTDSLYSLSETGQHSSIKPLRIGLRIGVPNLVTGNIEYVTPLFDNRLALTVDYLGISRSFTDGIFRFDNFRSEEHTSELQSRPHLVCRLLLEKKKHQHYLLNSD